MTNTRDPYTQFHPQAINRNALRRQAREMLGDYDRAALCEPDSSAAADLTPEVGDTVSVEQPYRTTWTGTVEAISDGMIDVWDGKLCRHGRVEAEYVRVVVKHEAQ